MPRVVHFEVHAEDPERAIAFYSHVLQWKQLVKLRNGTLPKRGRISYL